MTNVALVGDIGGTNSRFGVLELGSMDVRDVEVLKNDNFEGLEAAISAYVTKHGITELAAAAVDVAAPVDREHITLTNRAWTFSAESLRKAAHARRFRLLNDYEALAWSLPHLAAADLVQLGGEAHSEPLMKVVLGPGTGLGMAGLAPLPGGGWMPVPGEMGHVTLPIVTAEELALKDKIMGKDQFSEVEDVLTGPGLFALYTAIAGTPKLHTPEAVMKAGLARTDSAAVKTLDHFMTFLTRLAGDAAMALQARGGVYLAGGIAPSLADQLKAPKYRAVFEQKGRLSEVMRHIPLYVITDPFPAFKGCAAALNAK
ncbi:glucokinase [Aestuariivirga litoralis]|uniref:glucokinase n=1 Tax=Aestuariivirga litoralis TaxID=2650924 RepID=UPI0018C84E65|nr:glucokinase [Aestuariivirga litoralis]MBG1232890.1 glucokinase [Aestuariivirga litoralis]